MAELPELYTKLATKLANAFKDNDSVTYNVHGVTYEVKNGTISHNKDGNEGQVFYANDEASIVEIFKAWMENGLLPGAVAEGGTDAAEGAAAEGDADDDDKDESSPVPYETHEEVDGAKPISASAGNVPTDAEIDEALFNAPDVLARMQVTPLTVAFGFSLRVLERAHALAAREKEDDEEKDDEEKEDDDDNDDEDDDGGNGDDDNEDQPLVGPKPLTDNEVRVQPRRPRDLSHEHEPTCPTFRSRGRRASKK